MRIIPCINTYINILFPIKNDTRPCINCIHYEKTTKKCTLAAIYDKTKDKTVYMNANYVRINELFCGRKARYFYQQK